MTEQSPVAGIAPPDQHEEMDKKDIRLQLVISPVELEALDAWRAEKRIWSRSEAIRQLIAEGVKRGG